VGVFYSSVGFLSNIMFYIFFLLLFSFCLFGLWGCDGFGDVLGSSGSFTDDLTGVPADFRFSV